jgi:NhaP-type Na+/H+ or K+/H+ antiporter
MFAVVGTLVATFLTAVIVHYGTSALAGWCAPIPYVEAVSDVDSVEIIAVATTLTLLFRRPSDLRIQLTFGALISSIDPIAVLSVLSNMGMSDTDTVYVLIFGESLLNDGVAIVLFHTLVHFLDETLVIDRDAVVAAAVHFFVVAFGSLLVGVASGILSTVYFWMFYGCQSPLVEVMMFLCWALLPYYVCDGIGWSGIVAAVAVGFFMDLHIVGQHQINEDSNAHMDMSENTAASYESNDELKQRRSDKGRRRIFNSSGLLSTEARAHVGFVTELIATGMETAIFAYLGFFLISHRYHWNFFHVFIALLACCASRAIMIPTLSLAANWLTRMQQNRAACRTQIASSSNKKVNSMAGVIVDKKMQIALWFAGLRGAMSFALVEHIPLYDSFSGEGTRLKPELKAMTSASIMFTVFVLGGYTYYMMQSLGIAPANLRSLSSNTHEMTSLMNRSRESESDDEDEDVNDPMDNYDATPTSTPSKQTAFRRQRHSQVDSLITI